MTQIRFATRLNSFASKSHVFWPELKGKPSVRQMIDRAATVKGLTDLDLSNLDFSLLNDIDRNIANDSKAEKVNQDEQFEKNLQKKLRKILRKMKNYQNKDQPVLNAN